MRSLVAALVLAGCRLHFDERADAGDASVATDVALADAAPLALACNTPVALSTSTAASPHLSAAVYGSSFAAMWLDDLGQIVALGGTLLASGAVQGGSEIVNTGRSCSAVSIAIAGTTALVACGSTDESAAGISYLYSVDTTTGALTGGTTTSPIRVVSPRGLAGDNTAFVLGGITYNPGAESDVVRLSLAGVPMSSTAQVVAGNTNDRLAEQPNGTVVSVAFGQTIACTARLYGSGSLGPAVTWGNTGMCEEPIAIPSTTNSAILIVRKDTSDGDLNHQVATVSGLTLTLPGEGKLSGVSDEPRGIALGAGYWVGYHTAANMLEVIAVDATGGKGTPHTLGPMAALDAHDLFVIGGEPYAVWFSGGLQIAHLCP